ncbi:ubiquitin 3 binding protein But2 C-terminal domain-containing protein [Truncatella angustata]|uniref:Ubiquitin 3 binding protein But2 C-terminal domain-containing protein n=1 Tax=Truncatella angustata TaxID=152316 RepID=A0A9P8ZXU8_9PEZI|nr:ubiquitin 3 binding protein But2 C-terminal domain-containing protein [Truncatella angustata]KAH6653344.1 ubiquitin 3 binding protein But2 C-terminal domain-containing protein [Truncatella angustata]
MGGAHALATREAGCSLTFTTGGALSYPVGQISSGQTRAGGGLSAVSLTLESTSLTDSQGRGCWWTPPSTVLQCDVNQVPDSGFEIGCDGSVSYNGQTEFYECDAGEGDQINIYLQKPDTGLNCAQITLTASGCYPSDCSEASTPSTTGGVYVPSPSTVDIPDTCPANGVKNAGEFNLPSLIIVTDKSSPSTASGTQYNADISSTKSTIFNFDIPASASGKTCQLSFLFPMKDTLETSDFSFSGSGALDFSKLSNAATQTTSYSNAPDVASDLGQFTVSPGNAYKIYSFACPSGTTIGFEVADVSGGDTSLNFFQDYNPCPIGLFITTS